MTQVLLTVAVVVVAALVAWLLRRRRPEAPTQSGWTVPEQLDRSDFERPDAPWLVVLFTSATCDSCKGSVAKAEVLRSDTVAVAVVDYQSAPHLHSRYGVDAVPTVVIADRDGVVRASFVGPPTATDLWAAVAELREPGSTPPPEAHRPDEHRPDWMTRR